MVILKCHISILTVPVSKSHWLINFCVIGTIILCYIFTDKTFYMPTINVGFWMEDIFWCRCYLIYYYDGMHKETEQPEDACMHFLKMLRKMKATNTAKKRYFLSPNVPKDGLPNKNALEYDPSWFIRKDNSYF